MEGQRVNRNLLDLLGQLQERRWRERLQQEQNVLTRYIITFGCLIAMLSFCVLVLMFIRTSGGEFATKPVSRWDSGDVLDWAEGLGDWTRHTNITQLLQIQKITGPTLLLLDKDTLVEFGIKTDFQIKTILSSIEELMITEYSRPKTFYQWHSAYRRQAVIVTGLYKVYPRVTFLYIYYFEYHTMFLPLVRVHFAGRASEEDDKPPDPKDYYPSQVQIAVLFLEVLLVPHFIAGSVAWMWLFDNYVIICSAVLFHCFLETLPEVKWLIALLKARGIKDWKKKLTLWDKEHLLIWCGVCLRHSVSFMFLETILWYFVPYIICDLIFYLLVWHSPCSPLFVLVYVYQLYRKEQQLREEDPDYYGRIRMPDEPKLKV